MEKQIPPAQNRWKAVAIGAAIAGALTLPAVADSWLNGPTRNFQAHSVRIHDLVGNLAVAVKNVGPITVQVSGAKERVDATQVYQDDGDVTVDGGRGYSVWDWRHWFDFSDATHRRDSLRVAIVVPRGTSVSVDDLVGDARIGDTMAPLRFGAVATNSTIGKVSEARISLAGSGKIVVGDIAGELNADSAGSGAIEAGNAKSVHASLAGAGGLKVGQINGELHLDIAGSGDFAAARVNGPVQADVVGSGSVRIASGEANPLKVSIAGSGDFDFGGTAVDPSISAIGSGNVRLHAYRGNLSNSGMATVHIGD